MYTVEVQTKEKRETRYLGSVVPLTYERTLARLRLSRKVGWTISVKGITYFTNDDVNCKLCGTSETETLQVSFPSNRKDQPPRRMYAYA